jgi:hypothetical protein
MHYYVGNEGHHILELTRAETDELFDPFDPMDADLPSHLHHQRHRFIKQSTYDWLVANVSEPDQGWRTSSVLPVSRDQKLLVFDSKEKAMLFKLTFGGV